MPIVIGSKPESSFDDPIGLLQDCHRRIENFLSVLARLGGQTSLAPDERRALETALRYFREAAPKHTADEEESLFPRLRSFPSPGMHAIFERLSTLEGDHDRADRMHAEVDRLGQEWLTSGCLPAAGAARFSVLVAELGELYRRHIDVEESEVFPAAAAFGMADCRAMGEEMAVRRGLRQAR